MADPSAEDIVALRFKVEHAAAELGRPLAPLVGEHTGGRVHGTGLGRFGKEPGRALKEVGVGIGRAADFLAGHGVPGKESGGFWKVVVAMRLLDERALNAANVGHKLAGFEEGSEPVEPI